MENPPCAANFVLRHGPRQCVQILKTPRQAPGGILKVVTGAICKGVIFPWGIKLLSDTCTDTACLKDVVLYKTVVH